MAKIKFEVESAVGKKIRVTNEYWELIVKFKHPIIKIYENEVKETLQKPDVIRVSRKNSSVYLYYRQYEKLHNRYICVLVKHLNKYGFIITAYLADKVKKGEVIWQK